MFRFCIVFLLTTVAGHKSSVCYLSSITHQTSLNVFLYCFKCGFNVAHVAEYFIFEVSVEDMVSILLFKHGRMREKFELEGSEKGR